MDSTTRIGDGASRTSLASLCTTFNSPTLEAHRRQLSADILAGLANRPHTHPLNSKPLLPPSIVTSRAYFPSGAEPAVHTAAYFAMSPSPSPSGSLASAPPVLHRRRVFDYWPVVESTPRVDPVVDESLETLVAEYRHQPDLLRTILEAKAAEDRCRAEEACRQAAHLRLTARQMEINWLRERSTATPSRSSAHPPTSSRTVPRRSLPSGPRSASCLSRAPRLPSPDAGPRSAAVVDRAPKRRCVSHAEVLEAMRRKLQSNAESRRRQRLASNPTSLSPAMSPSVHTRVDSPALLPPLRLSPPRPSPLRREAPRQFPPAGPLKLPSLAELHPPSLPPVTTSLAR
ncbi:hypothetical protein IWQ60_002756 [Tieghemiomyces parasiticus]|uniref:Uncharacterized protein n=1 Tax=Tieghemiomyces parasiticus TaxID=78921 RepID=A0A9W8AJ06_9FUNG|nr:hypothetical protein IWQ60_002756 [Tieghemiomyces parasiticus]